MREGSILKRCLSLVLAFTLLLGLASPAAAAIAKLGEETYGYVAFGDAMTEGIGLDDAAEEAYTEKVAKYLGTKPTLFADKRYRIEELRYLLDYDYSGDGYTKALSGLNTLRNAGTVIDYVKNAEVISINIGVNNFATYLVEQMVYYLENKGAVKYSYSFDSFGNQQVTDAMEKVKAAVMDRLLAAAPADMEEALELIEYVAEVATYTYLSYITSFNAAIEKIYELNPDVDLYVVGVYNPMAGEVLSVDVASRTFEVPIGSAFGALVELANFYTQVLGSRAFDYIYVDPGTPELLIDRMGNTNLKDEDRIPQALKYELLSSVDDAAIDMIQKMFAQYGIAKTDDEAYAIAEEIFEKNSADRLAYIKSLIQDYAVKEVIDRFKTELENYASTYGKITVTEEEIKTLLDNLDAATTEGDRKEEATKFVVDLMTKAMIGQTFAGIEINSQQDAYDAIALLERNSQGDPDALREAAADMIMAKVGENGLKDFIQREDVLDLLEQMDTTTTDAERTVVIHTWMNELAVEKIVEKIKDINPQHEYTKADARALLAAMEAAPEDEREGIAKNHMLTVGGFHAFMVAKFEQAYVENGLTLKGYPSFDAFVTAVETADTNAKAEAIVREAIRAAAAEKVINSEEFKNIARLLSGVDAEDLSTWFKTVDDSDKAPRDEFFAIICDFYKADPNNLNVIQAQVFPLMVNEFVKGYNIYNVAADAAQAAVSEYRKGVDTAAEGFAQYVSLKDTAAQQILDAYNQQYQGAGETALKYYADYLSLRDEAVKKVLQGYDEYNRAVNLGLDTVDHFNETFDCVFDQLREIAEVEKISLNHLVAVAKKLDANYVQSMVENLVQGDTLAVEDKTVAYIALRYYLANAMMIMPSANGHAEIANRIIEAIKTKGSVNSTAGELANKVINTGLDIYHCAKEFLSLPTGASGQAEILKNPEILVALGDNVTSGTALKDPALAYPQLLADMLAMDYINEDMDAEDNLYNYALNGMRAEELLMLVDGTYSGDAYTAERFGVSYIEKLRAEYAQNIKNADLITINVGINNLTTFPIQQTLLAFNGEETYEMDWARYLGQSRYEKIAKGKTAVMDLLLKIVDNAESRKPVLDDLNAYEKAERALNTVATAVESLVYGLIGYAVNLDAAVETIAKMNPDATIVLIGFYNPLEGTYINIDRTVSIRDHELDLSKYTVDISALTDKVINVANRFLTNYVGFIADDKTAADAGSRIVSVPILNTELGVSDTGASKDLSTLTTWRTVNVKGHEVDIMVPEYFLHAGHNVGVNLHPNADGHAYIANKIMDALKYEIHATVHLGDGMKYFGAAEPGFDYLIDDLSSLYGEDAIVLDIQREPGEAIGEYKIYADVTFDGYTSVTVVCGTFKIVPMPVTITVNPGDTTIKCGDDIPNYTAVVKDINEKVIEGLAVEITGVPADSNTAKSYEISAKLDNANYTVTSVSNAVLNIEKVATPVIVEVLLSQSTIQYGRDLPTYTVVVKDELGNVISDAGEIVSGMPENSLTLGTYTITAELGNEDYVIKELRNASLIIDPLSLFVTVDPGDTTITVGDALPNYELIVTDDQNNVLFGLPVEITGVPANSNTAGTHKISAEVVNNGNYSIDSIVESTLTIKVDENANAKITSGLVTLTLEGQVYIDYCINLSGFSSDVDFARDGGVVIWNGDKAPTSGNQLQVDAANCIWKDGCMWYSDVMDSWTVSSNGINAKEYGDLVYMRAYVKVGEDKYVYGPAIKYSPERYCRAALEDGSNLKLTEVCAAMLAYGTAAQKYFDYNLNALVDSGLDLTPYSIEYNENMLDALDRPTAEKANTLTGTRQGVGNATVTLSLEAAIVIDFVSQISVPNIDKVQLLVWNEEDYANAETLAYEAGTYTYAVDMEPGVMLGISGYVASSVPIPAKEIGDTLYYSIRVTDTNGEVYRGGLGCYSPDQYVRSAANHQNAELADVVRALAVYSEKARVVFNYKLQNND